MIANYKDSPASGVAATGSSSTADSKKTGSDKP